MATDIAWDPTGRYVATAVTISQEMEEGFKKGFHWETVRPRNPPNGFFIWSFKGEKLYWRSTPNEYRLLQLNWRPYGGSIDEELLKNQEKPIEEDSVNWASEEESVKWVSEEESENLASEEESENLASEEVSENSASEEESENLASEEESDNSASEED
ncbi:eukaryotic translation initiation factor 3 subunit B-like [Eutrema salsugineum]|nr:eukaryotic translation initiation factor 3 subunit B-like [Eutrema salsugineum]